MNLIIPIIFISLVAFVAALMKRRSRDKCLRDFDGASVTIEDITGKTLWGKMRVEHTGLELTFTTEHETKDGHQKTSYILYKNEFPNIRSMLRFHDELSEEGKKERELELERTYHPVFSRRMRRKIANLFHTVRDSILEVVNLLMTQAKGTSVAGATLTSQDQYVSQIKQEVVGGLNTSFEPLLERHIGKRVVLELKRGDNTIEYSGILKEYTAEFIEIMDVDYRLQENDPGRKADLVVPRTHGIIRHLAE